MLRRSVKIQLIIFVVITLLGISYVGAEYVGLGKYVAGNGCTISAEFPDSGGIFTNAEVTYRGVTVGRVGALTLTSNPPGVKVDLNLDNCDSPKIPSNAAATVADRSVIGEQYVDLAPPPGVKAATSYVSAGTTIPMNYPDGKPRNQIPTATQTLLVNLDKLVNSVPLDDLHTTIEELDKAVAGRGPDLGTLLDATNALLQAASQPDTLAATKQLIADSATVLQTQLDEAPAIDSWTHSLNLLSQQLKASDPDIRHLFDTGPTDLATIRNFISDNQTDLGVTLAELSTVGNLLVRHLPGIEEILELYPALAAGGQTSLHGGYGWLSLVVQSQASPGAQLPPACGDINKGQQGYQGTVRRGPENLSPIAPNISARCTGPNSGSGYTNVRGSANVPGGDPISLSGGGYAYPRTLTDNTLQSGPAIGSSGPLGNGLVGAAPQ